MEKTTYFRTEDMTVGYNGIPLISEISFSIDKGEILTLIGPNGSGKSTILKSITRHLNMLAGVVYIDKDDIRRLSGGDCAKKLSVVLTEKIRVDLMTCGDVVATGRYPYTNHFGLLTAHDKRIVDDSLEKVHALDLKDRSFRAISDGQRQRIMLARAICQDPEIIVLDEPTSFLDIRHKIELLDILREMSREKNITIIMSLHEIDLAQKISDKVMCVKGDKIARFGTPAEIFSDDIICELYDIENGSYNSLFGCVELSRPEGNAEIFVIGGGGYGIPFYRELQKKKLPFYAGILYENDVDYQVAEKLVSKAFSGKAFTPIPDEVFVKAASALKASKLVVDTGCPVGDFNRENGRLLQLARENNIPIISRLEDLPA